MKNNWSEEQKFRMCIQLGSIFQPSAPIDRRQLFSGRRQQMTRVIDAINQPGQHAIIFGERGVGKTSLANVLVHSLEPNAGEMTKVHINCNRNTTYDSLWAEVFNSIIDEVELNSSQSSHEASFVAKSMVDGPSKVRDPNNIHRALSKIGANHLLVVVIDEFDSIQDTKCVNLVADTLKLLSDRNSPVTVVLVGVASSIGDLIAGHQSIDRCLKQVPLPRMSVDELKEIVIRGLNEIKMSILEKPLQEIADLSKGLPHYTHLLGLHAGRNAINNDRSSVESNDFINAIRSAIDDTQESVRQGYQLATYSTRKTMYKEVLLACAMSTGDEFGFFTPAEICNSLNEVTMRNYTVEHYSRHLHKFCEEERGGVLKKIGPKGRNKFRFRDPLMQPFVIMNGLNDELIGRHEI